MNEDMSNLISKFSSMLKNNELPSELSDIMRKVSNNNSNNDNFNNSNFNNNNSGNENCNNNLDRNLKPKGLEKDMSSNLQNTTSTTNFDFNNINIDAIKNLFEQKNNSNEETNNSNEENTSFNFDINTMLKMKSIIDAMNSKKDDPRANLLKSLKPYLKESRKEKVDQYIKIFNMERVFETINPIGGGKKNDV